VEGDDDTVGRQVGVGLEVAVAEIAARAKAGSVFSGASPAPPRWAKARIPGWSRYGHADAGT
jgi:hypothetical protein